MSCAEKNHFKRYGNTQKYFCKGESGEIDYEVDIVPFGGVAIDEKICWPPEGNPAMSVKCFQDVMKEAVTVIIDDMMKIKMAPLFGQFLIKLDTWNDRNASTDKDAEDMLFILKNYFDIQLLYKEDNIPPDVVKFDDDNRDTIVWGAQWMAFDISKLLTTDHLQFYTNLVVQELNKEESSNLIYHFMKYYGNSDVDDISSNYEPCRLLWETIVEIFNKELEERNKR